MAIKGKKWTVSEEKKLIDNYTNMTIHELMVLFPKRTQESINNKIKRLKAVGKIQSGKDDDVIKRSYEQRGMEISFILDQKI